MGVRPLGFKLSKAQALKAQENMNLARREAWRFQRRTDMTYDDLESVAFIGLMKACFKFDVGRGWKFSTYAVPVIRGELLHYVRDHSYLLRLSHRMRENWVKGRRFLDRGHTDQQVADELKIKLAEWLDTRQACSGAPLELKESLHVADKSLEAKEDDRLSRLELAVQKSWSRMGEVFAKNLAAHYRFDHLLKPHAADTFVSNSLAIYDGRDICWMDYGCTPEASRPTYGIQSASAQVDDAGIFVIESQDLGNGREQRSLFEDYL
ncbi:RNA polymerase sigma factor/ sigma-70 family protein [Synechococcus sp. SYN20]|uniref:sigma factor n=1 Tax=Synechococcus sp. SYN20 TaxID=1050714 RepID=UPI0018618889|nr:sigma factor [Synechococcus sp. SYN20]QNJ25907.1 RNA polymerase sigma factor/ sigma-70 family protein [Synechococcus sp. SYN20]